MPAEKRVPRVNGFRLPFRAPTDRYLPLDRARIHKLALAVRPDVFGDDVLRHLLAQGPVGHQFPQLGTLVAASLVAPFARPSFPVEIGPWSPTTRRLISATARFRGAFKPG